MTVVGDTSLPGRSSSKYRIRPAPVAGIGAESFFLRLSRILIVTLSVRNKDILFDAARVKGKGEK